MHYLLLPGTGTGDRVVTEANKVLPLMQLAFDWGGGGDAEQKINAKIT